MSVSGQVVEVRTQDRGSEVVGAPAAGATSVTVADPTPFDVDGQVWIDGTAYTCTAVTEVDDPLEAGSTNGVLTLDAGLAAAVTEGTPVAVWSGTQILDDVILDVVTMPGEPPVSVTLTAGQRKDWTMLEGPVDPPVAVVLSDDLSVLEDAPGYSPTFDSTQSASPMLMAAKGANQTIANNTWTAIDGWFILQDDRITADAAGKVLTVQVDGVYDLRVGVSFDTSAVGSRAVQPHIYGVDGGDSGPLRLVKLPADGRITVETAQYVRLVAGQSVTFEAWQSSGANLDVRGSNVFLGQPVTDCAIRWVGPL
ncbi:MAG: hypothetical protein HOQ21_01350 [Dermatophilaceae bacterium]|nr:hypothetical protein [Dermatophilaceae bacterium]